MENLLSFRMFVKSIVEHVLNKLTFQPRLHKGSACTRDVCLWHTPKVEVSHHQTVKIDSVSLLHVANYCFACVHAYV